MFQDSVLMKRLTPFSECSEKLLYYRYHLDEVFPVRSVHFFSDTRLEIYQHVYAVFSEISEMLLSFCTVPIGRLICEFV